MAYNERKFMIRMILVEYWKRLLRIPRANTYRVNVENIIIIILKYNRGILISLKFRDRLLKSQDDV